MPNTTGFGIHGFTFNGFDYSRLFSKIHGYFDIHGFAIHIEIQRILTLYLCSKPGLAIRGSGIFTFIKFWNLTTSNNK